MYSSGTANLVKRSGNNEYTRLKKNLRSDWATGIENRKNGFHSESNSAWNPFFRFSSSRFLKNILKIPSNFPDPKFSDATAALPVGQANFKTLPWLSLAPPDGSGALPVVLRTSWVKSNRVGGAGRRLKNIQFCFSQKDSTKDKEIQF